MASFTIEISDEVMARMRELADEAEDMCDMTDEQLVEWAREQTQIQFENEIDDMFNY